MIDLDDLGAALGRDADFGPEAAERLVLRLAAERSPRAAARRKAWGASAAFVVAATLGGGAVGALTETGQAGPAAIMLPAGQGGTAASLLFGDGR